MADYIGATPQVNPLMGLLAERLKQAQGFAAKPFGYSNPPAEMLMNLLGVPAVQQTAERLAYGEPMTTGRGMTTQIRPEVMEAAMTVAPVAGLLGRGVERGAMAAGRAGERLAERVVPQVMERGGLPAQIMQDMSRGSISPMDVWHGSPYGPFQKFDPSKARTGEGNATFGEGAYLAQARGTGETYRDVLSAGKQAEGLLSSDKMSDKIAANTLQMYKTPAKAIDALESGLTPNLTGEARQATNDAIDALKGIDKNAGYLYKVDLPDESIAKMLDYDKPLSKQAPEVQNALAELGISVDKKKMGEYEDALLDALTNPNATGQLPKQPLDLTGEQILKELERNASRYFPNAMEGKELTAAMINPRAGVSELLAKKGVPGVRYLDQMSRDAGDGTSNFVVFPKYQDLLTIKEINDKPVGGLLGQSKDALPNDYYELNGMATQAYTDLRANPSQETADFYKSIMKARDEAPNNPSNNYTPPVADVVDEGYKGQHLAPTKDGGAPLWDMKGIYPDDFYSYQGAQYYGDGAEPARDAMIVRQMQSLKGRPNAEVTIYRAVPKSVPTKEALNVGDWITLDRKYAKEHGEGALNGDYKIIRKTVKARDLFTNGDSIYEMGYDPQPFISTRKTNLLD